VNGNKLIYYKNIPFSIIVIKYRFSHFVVFMHDGDHS